MNAFKTALASTILTASVAFSGAASAQTPAAPAASNEACVALGQSKGVFEYPASRRGFQEEGDLGCVFGYGASGGFIPLAAYNLNDPRQSQRYAQEVNRANQMEDRAAMQGQRQAEADARRAEAEARRNSPDRILQERTRQIRSIENSVRQLERIFK
ncbi:MAG: hypothetical protein ACXW30_06555 [Micavibrio sp.]